MENVTASGGLPVSGAAFSDSLPPDLPPFAPPPPIVTGPTFVFTVTLTFVPPPGPAGPPEETRVPYTVQKPLPPEPWFCDHVFGSESVHEYVPFRITAFGFV